MANRKKGMPRAMRLEAMSKEKKQPLKLAKKDVAEKPVAASPFPLKGMKGAALSPAHVKARGKAHVKANMDAKLQAPHKRRQKAAKGKK